MLTACPGDEIVEDADGSSGTGGSTSSDDTTGKPPTTEQPTETTPTTTNGPMDTGTTMMTTVDDTGTSTTSGETMTTGTTDMLLCSNGMLDPGETCDGSELNGEDCVSQGFGGGTLACAADCGSFDTSGCTDLTCGNNTIDDPETCDGDDLAGETCMSQGFDDGVLACAGDCSGFDTAGCVLFSCGNNTVEGNEVCDGDDLAGADCVSQGFMGGVLACDANCGAFDTSGCFACGNDLVDGTEVCDGADLAGQDCASQGFVSGTLACSADCTAFDTSTCESCGDNAISGDDVCDGSDLGGADCASQGFFGGTLACQADCAALDVSMCTDCGNNTVDPNETCDGSDLDGETCMSQGFFKGNLTCQPACDDYDLANCSNCGNNTIDPPETCDGNLLGGATCAAQNLEYGYVCCGGSCATNFSNCADEFLESEPNDDGMTAVNTNDFSTANADGPFTSHTVAVGALVPAGDDDIYAVTNNGMVPAILTAETFGVNGPGTCPNNDTNMDTVIEVRDANNTMLASSDDEGIGYCSRITNFVVPANTTYYLRVIDLGDNLMIAKYYLDIDLRPVACGDGNLAPTEACDDGNLIPNDGCSATCTIDSLTAEIEPNATNAEADATGLISTGNSRYTGAIEPVADLDRYRLDLAQPKWVRFETFSKNNDCLSTTTNLRVFDAANTSLIADTSGAGIAGCSSIIFPFVAGQFYAQVEETGNNASIPQYLVDIKALTENGSESEPNENQAAADTNIQTGTDVMVFGDHPAAADIDFYAIDVAGCGSSLRLEIVEGDRAVETCESNGIDSFLTLFDSNGKQLDLDDDSGRGFCSAIDGTGTVPQHPGAHDLASGTYFVRVTSSPVANAGGAVFSYRLAATVRSP